MKPATLLLCMFVTVSLWSASAYSHDASGKGE